MTPPPGRVFVVLDRTNGTAIVAEAASDTPFRPLQRVLLSYDGLAIDADDDRKRMVFWADIAQVIE